MFVLATALACVGAVLLVPGADDETPTSADAGSCRPMSIIAVARTGTIVRFMRVVLI
jgi:hypothetical protein